MELISSGVGQLSMLRSTLKLALSSGAGLIAELQPNDSFSRPSEMEWPALSMTNCRATSTVMLIGYGR